MRDLDVKLITALQGDTRSVSQDERSVTPDEVAVVTERNTKTVKNRRNEK